MALSRKVIVGVDGGLHARPAAQIAQYARGCEATLTVQNEAHEASARSALELLMLGAREGDMVELRASGPGAAEALAYLAALIEDKEASAHAQAPSGRAQASAPLISAAQGAASPASGLQAALTGETVGATITDDSETGQFRGQATSPGFAYGPVWSPGLAPAPARIEAQSGHEGGEGGRATAALRAVADECRSAAQASDLGGEAAAILLALADLAGDETWQQLILERISAGAGAMQAVRDSGEALALQIAALADPFSAARASDMRALAERVILRLQGKAAASLADAPEGAIVVLCGINALHLAGGGIAKLGGIISDGGEASGHAAIILRAAGVPAVFGLKDDCDICAAAGHLAIDGGSGRVICDPDEAALAAFSAEAREAEGESPPDAMLAAALAHFGVSLAANVGSQSEAEAALARRASGIGLVRSEILFAGEADIPDEEGQLAAYAAILALDPAQEVVIRVFDIGGDKPFGSHAPTGEANPFLGLRGIRLCLERPLLFRPQLRALLRAAPYGRLQVLLPMVADPGELQLTRALIADLSAELQAEGLAFGSFGLGIMVETPAAVFQIDALAREADFLAIGSNDLAQYIMAADRGNPAVAALCRSDHPAVQAALRSVVAAGAAAGRRVSLCGEAAADPALLPLLLDLGLRHFSVSPAALPRLRRALCALPRGAAPLSGV